MRTNGEDPEHATALARSAVELPPVLVHRPTMRVLDGMHRLNAARLRGDRSIDVVFFDGDEPDPVITDFAPNPVRPLRRPATDPDAVLVPLRPATRVPRPSTPVHQVAAEFELDPRTVVEVLDRLRRCRRATPGAQPRLEPLPAPAVDATSLVLDRVCDELFATLTRRDQRLRARQYLRGLLETDGRKTIRNIAARVEGRGIDQRLHHFISDSTWDWEPVRTALARYVTQAMEPEAWVIRPVLVPKAGRQAVAVTRRFCPTRGKTVHGQQAVGVLAVSEAASVPVSWRLQLPREWVEDPHRRARAAMPDDVGAESLGDCAAQAYLRVLDRTGSADRPAVLDGRDMEPNQLLRPLHTAEAPLLVRIASTILLQVDDPTLAGHRTPGPLTARKIVESARFRSRPIAGPDARIESGHLLTTVDVRWPCGGESPAADLPMQLIAVSPLGENVCEELWLTTMTTVPTTTILRLSKLVRRVDRDLDAVSRHAGIWDFSGRSFPGWHRHVTLASAAHLVRLLARTDYRADLLSPGETGTSH
ncbi:MAG: transposase [Umezawaea sp.]